VVDFFLVVVFEFVFDGEAVGFVESGGYVQEVALEACEVVHVEFLLLGRW